MDCLSAVTRPAVARPAAAPITRHRAGIRLSASYSPVRQRVWAPRRAQAPRSWPCPNNVIRGRGGPVRATAAASLDTQAGSVQQHTQLADRWLGSLFLKLLPGPLYYLPSFLFLTSVVVSGLGAAFGPALLRALAALPAIQALGPLGPALALVTQERWAGLAAAALALVAPLYAFLAMPSLDFLMGRDLRSAAQEGSTSEDAAALHRHVLHVYAVTHACALLLLCHILCTTACPPLAFLCATLSAGVGGGILFTVAHELLHGGRLDRQLAGLLLALVGYMHWSESHLQHHVKVATREDPASARRGESLWAFVPRSVAGNLVDGYGVEAARLRSKGLPLLSLHNRIVWWLLCPALLAGSAYLAYGVKGLAFFVGQAVGSIVMLESVNYLEHYGLEREKLADGRYERVGPQHSWNCNWLFTSANSFRLQRHADHHMHGSKPYHLLENLAEAPQLPASYPAMMTLALFPPLFFGVMDPRIDEYLQQRRLLQQQQQAEVDEASEAAGATEA